MKLKLWSALVLMLIFSCLVLGQTKNQSAENILQKSFAKLVSLKTIKYKFSRELNYSSEGYLNKSEANSFVDFTNADNLAKAIFQFEQDDYLMVYNGSELFSLDKNKKTIEVKDKPVADDLIASSFLGNTPITLKNLFPQLIEDKTIIKKLSETTAYYIIEFELENQSFDKLGRMVKAETAFKHTFLITIDKKNLIPTEVLQKLNKTDFIKTNLSEIVINPQSPVENSWYYSTYLSEYKYAKPKEDNLIKAGSTAPNFKLPLVGSNKQVSLSDYKGKVVLLEFWIAYCGACIASVPKLNQIQAKFKNQNFTLLSINSYETPKLIDLFVTKNKSEYPILYQGEEVFRQYGVWFYPTVVLIGKDGKVIYSGKFDQEKIEDLTLKSL